MTAIVIETLEQRLARLLPGAECVRLLSAPPTEAWRVVRKKRVLGVGATKREAIDRALFLFGSSR